MDPGPDPGEGVSVVEELMDHVPVLIGEMPVLFRNFIVIVHVVRPFQAYPYQWIGLYHEDQGALSPTV